MSLMFLAPRNYVIPVLPSAPSWDPYWDNTVLLMHMDGADNSTVFIDETGKDLTVAKSGTGSLPKLSSATKKFGSAGGVLNSTTHPNGACVQTYNDGTFDFGTATDFTIECFINPVGSSGGRTIVSTWQWAGGYRGGWSFNLGTNNVLYLFNYTTYLATTVGIEVGSWSHVAVSRSGNTTYFFINGNLVHSTTESINLSRPLDTHAQNLRVGCSISDSGYFDTGMTAGIDELRITRGIARYTSNFTVPTSRLPDASNLLFDPYWSNVSLLMHMDGADNGTVFTEETGRPVTRYGTPKTIESTKKFGLSSGYFDGNNSYLTVPPSDAFNFGTGDFTLETFIYWDGTYDSSGRIIFATGGSGSLDQFGIFSSGLLYGAVYGGYPPINVWTHVAATRKSGILRLFIDGVKTAETSVASSIGSSVATAFIGRRGDGFHPFKGYIEELRITKGVARYTANFSVPGNAFATQGSSVFDPYWASTVLLAHMDGMDNGTRFIEETGKVVTAVGSAVTKTSTKKFGNSSLSLDGVGSYLVGNNIPALAFAADDFTIEGWFYLNSYLDKGLFQISTTAGGLAGHSGLHLGTRPNSGGFLMSFDGALRNIAYAIVTSTWTHFAVVRKSGVFSLYINGVSVFSEAIVLNISGTNAAIGAYYDSTSCLNGYIDEFRVTKGIARYTSNFVPQSISYTDQSVLDYYWDNTVLLMHMDGADNGVVFTDEKGKAVTAVGSAVTKISTKKFGSASGYFGGSGNYLTIPPSTDFNFGIGDFTIEFWLNATILDAGGLHDVLVHNVSGGMQLLFVANKLRYNIAYVAGLLDTTTVFSTNTWYHVALTRTSGTTRWFINGVLDSTLLNDTNTWNLSSSFSVGGGVHSFTGYLEELRITKGVARYTANFTVPTQQFIEPTVDPYWAYTSLAVRANGTNGSTLITDEKGTALTLNGGIALSTAQKKFGLSSVFFDGSTDYLRLPNDPKFNNFGTGDFTLETWIYVTNLSSHRAIFSCINGWPSTVAYQFEIRTNGDLRFFAGNNLTISIASGTGAIVANTWTHVAVSRKNGSTKMFINGIQYGSTHVGSVNINLATTCYIGFTGYYSEAMFIGYMDDLRITKGAARYTGNFVPRNSEMLLG